MSLLSNFYGITIEMHKNDEPPACFHAKYNEDEIVIEIEGSPQRKGSLPHRAFGIVMEWALIHRTELKNNWNLIQQGLPPTKINPLD